MRAIGFYMVSQGSPVIVSVTVDDAAKKDFIVIFDLPIMDILPPVSAFTIRGLTVKSVAKTGDKEIKVTTNEDAISGVVYVLCYNHDY